MAAAPWLSSAALGGLALASFLLVFTTGFEFIRFVSFSVVLKNISGDEPCKAEASVKWSDILQDRRAMQPLGGNALLILLFILQHSLMANESVKQWTARGFGVLQRSLYVACTALCLQVLMRYWQPVAHGPYLWNACTEPWNTWLSMLCFVLHFVSWLVIFSIALVFDYAELMGIKQMVLLWRASSLEVVLVPPQGKVYTISWQAVEVCTKVYYHCLGMGDPLALKSQRAVRLYSHLRHPVYLEFLIILWAVPCLALDRLLLASLLTLYLTFGHGLDQQDYHYLRAQLDKKFLIFSREELTREPFLLRRRVDKDS